MFVPYAHTYTLVSIKLCYCYYKMLFICLLLPKCNQLQEMDFVLYCVVLFYFYYYYLYYYYLFYFIFILFVIIIIIINNITYFT